MGRKYGPGLIVALAGIAALGLVSSALAAHPSAGKAYSGSGRLCQNNGPGHHFTVCGTHDTFSFHTSADAKRVTNFAGHLGPLYCGQGRPTITAVFITVHGDGSFRYTFSVPYRGATGQVTGAGAVQISGRFTGTGRTAKVFYRLVLHTNGQPKSSDCGAQVSGSAQAH